MSIQQLVFGNTAESDPYWSSVKLALHFDGADASTTFTDQKSHTVTANGSVQIDTAQSKFGGASGWFTDETTDYLTLADSADWDTDTKAFTIEMFVRWTGGITGTHLLMGQGAGAADDTGPCLWVLGNNTLQLSYYDNVGNGTAVNVTCTTLLVDTWYHIAVTRSGTSAYFFLNGVKQGATQTVAATFNNSARTMYVGGNGGTSVGVDGWIDDLRFTVGVARYTADFTPPTKAFPNQ